MRVKHGDHSHEVYLCDDGTLDTVITVDGHEARFSEADRHSDGSVKEAWLREAAIEACDDGLLEDEEVEDAGDRPDGWNRRG
jgi:hypothetical protein